MRVVVIALIPRMLFYLHRLRRNLRLKPSDLRKLQWEKLRATVKHAYEHVPFYHRKFKGARFNPDDLKTFDDLRKIPVTTKLEVQACDLLDMVTENTDLDSLTKRRTSGSTGVPLTTLVDGRVSDFEAAVWMRALFEDGLRVRDKMSVIADPRSFPKKESVFQRLGLAKRKYISIFDSAERQLALIKEFKPDVVKGYASSLFILAEEFEDLVGEIESRLVFSGAEVLDAPSKKLISSRFGAELFDCYACSELGLLAWECKEHSGYHVNADSVLMEFVGDGGEAVAFGEKGRVVCTGLFNRVMPLIRYELDDVVVPVNDECACGRSLPLVKFVEGRADDLLVAADGRLISPTLFFPYPFESVDWIKRFRVIQESRKRLVIQVAPKKAVENQSQIIEAAERKLHELFGNLEVKFEFMENIPLDNSGKFRKVISRINSRSRNR
ncbi:MAG: hypothetical protein QHH24_00895 [Candidatus Bathyarchaeota archaeon]|nr:hypothetical protein [Candidatus Bathyarchaeota archaeon]